MRTTALSPRAAATRSAILEAARACFAERGLVATTTRAIARRAGVTQPLVHHYFGSKDALFDAVLEASMHDYTDAQTEQWARDMDDVGFFTRGLDVLFAWLGQQRDVMRLAAWARLEGRAWEPSPGAVAVAAHVRARLARSARVDSHVGWATGRLPRRHRGGGSCKAASREGPLPRRTDGRKETSDT